MKPQWSSADSLRLLQLRQGKEPVELDRKGKRIVLPTDAERAARHAGEQWIRRYAGENRFVLSLQSELKRPGVRFLTDRQLAGAAAARDEEQTGVKLPRPQPKASPTQQRSRGRSTRPPTR